MRSFSLLKKLLLTVLPLLCISIVLQLVGFSTTLKNFEVMKTAADSFERRVYRLSDVSNLKSYLFLISISYRNLLLAKDTEMRAEFVKQRAHYIEELVEEKKKFLSNATEKEQIIFAEIDKTIEEFMGVSKRFDELWMPHDEGVLAEEIRLKGHQIILEELVPLRDKVGGLISQVITEEIEDTKRAKEASDKLFQQVQQQGTYLNCAIVFSSVLMAFLLVVRLRKTVTNLGSMSDYLNNLGSSAKAASEQIALASNTLAHESSQAATSLAETSAAIGLIKEKSQLCASAASESAVLGKSSLSSAKKGEEKVGELVQSVQLISESSSRIAQISKMIDEVAFQTNLLALNAAVEAARAGDAGKGFAVVAEEVRSLAQRCSHSAQDINTVIHETVEKLHESLSIAESAKGSLNEIISAAERVSDINSQVAKQIGDQQVQMKEISEAIVKLDNSTHSNAAASQETAASAQEILKQSESLSTLAGELVVIIRGKSAEPIHF